MGTIEKDELIITLILQDLKHCQLVFGLDQLNLDAGYRHFLGIMDLVGQLMEIPESETNTFYDTYMNYLQQCMDYPVSSNGEELKPLAEACFFHLADIQKRIFNTSLKPTALAS